MKLLPAPQMRLSDIRFPSTISLAVMELDRASRGEKVNWEATPFLGRALSELMGTPTAASDRRKYQPGVDMVNVMGEALIRLKGHGMLKTVEDVCKCGREIVVEIAKVERIKKREEFRNLNRFCIAFGNSLLDHRASRDSVVYL